MLHVFIINSHTTFLTAMGTTNYLHLKDEEVVFLYMRNYKNTLIPVPFKIFDISALYTTIQKNWNSQTEKKYTEKADEFAASALGRSYYLYTPHLAAVFFKLLYTNRKCKRVAFLQEGAICQQKVFTTNNSIISKLFIFKRLFWNKDRNFGWGWYVSGCIYKQLRLDSYAINNEYFKNLPSRNHIVKWPQMQLNDFLKKGNNFFVFDGFVGNQITEETVYLQNCRNLIFEYAKDYAYVKFHPEQNQQERYSILSFFKEKNVKTFIIDDSIPMECIVSSTKNKTFIGFGSSILHFAVDYGHHVICHDDWLMETSPLYKKHHETWGLVLFKDLYGRNLIQ